MVSATERKKAKKRREDFIPDFKAEWINAFIIAMLHKIGGVQSLTMDQLKAFDKVTDGKEPEFLWSSELQAFTLKAPKYEVQVIATRKLKIIT